MLHHSSVKVKDVKSSESVTYKRGDSARYLSDKIRKVIKNCQQKTLFVQKISKRMVGDLIFHFLGRIIRALLDSPPHRI
jgi:hypothetical protein